MSQDKTTDIGEMCNGYLGVMLHVKRILMKDVKLIYSCSGSLKTELKI